MESQGGTMVLYSHHTVGAHIINRGHYDPEYRVNDLDKCGIDTQIISLTIPGVEEMPAEEGLKWARYVNDYFAEVCHKYPGRFYACATLPFQDVAL